MYVNQFDKNAECAIIGRRTEDLFELFLQKTNKEYRRATLLEQYNHIDFVVLINKKSISIDIKGPKKVNRIDSDSNKNLLWVEFKNVRGDNGWLYGKNDLTAFYKIDDSSFYVVRTKELVKLCENLCDDKIVYHPYQALYHKYSREGREDVIAMIKYEDLSKIYCIRLSMKTFKKERYVKK